MARVRPCILCPHPCHLFSISPSLCPSLSLFCCASLGLWGMGRGWTLDVFGLGFLGCLLGVGSWELTWTFYKYVVIFSGLGVLYFYDHNRGHASREALQGCYFGACHGSRRGYVVRFWHTGTPQCLKFFSPAAREGPVLLNSGLSRRPEAQCC